MVIEGAGSPAEVNLKSHDIVNMAVARHAGAPVLLVGDIDRGGVYASFVGTLETMAEWERDLVAGFVVNRFRGKESLLEPAHDYVLRHTNKPVLGVVPFLPQLGLPEEDSVTFKADLRSAVPDADTIDIALIDLPHISNFTDFDALGLEPDVAVRVVRTAVELGTPDAVILPGSKSVANDLLHLRESGLAESVIALAHSGRAEIIGICGGYQMLGHTIADPLGVESGAEIVEALGLLPASTVLAAEKTLERVEAEHVASGMAVCGYEIHHGNSSDDGTLAPAIVGGDGRIIGTGRGRVWGSYLHGMFDADPFRRWFIDRLRRRKGLAPIGQVVAVYDVAAALDRLADSVRERLDIEKIYQLMGL
jgi:cobyric acid synthase CobQ